MLLDLARLFSSQHAVCSFHVGSTGPLDLLPVTFSGWLPPAGCFSHAASVKMKSNDCFFSLEVSRQVKLEFQESQFFHVVHPKNAGKKVAPGMSLVYTVCFTPQDNKVRQHLAAQGPIRLIHGGSDDDIIQGGVNRRRTGEEKSSNQEI